MSSQSRITELSATIAQHTQLIDKFLCDKSLPQPSFDANGPSDLQLTKDLENSRALVLQATQELNDLLQGPRNLLFNHFHNTLLPLHLISHFDLAQLVPLNGQISFHALASSIGINQSALTSILRLGIACRIFSEPQPGFIAHSAASRQIAEDVRVASWVGSNVDDMAPAAARVVDALVKWPEAGEPNQTGFALANGSEESFYDILAKSPERAKRFGGAMSCFTTGEGYSLVHLTGGYPWERVAAGTVVDVGGSYGDVAFALAREYPHLKLVVQELPEVVANAQRDESLDVRFMEHSFFEEQPVKGAEVYLFRWILHNWPDKYCVRILRGLVPALKKGAKVLVMDGVSPPPGVLPNDLERNLRVLDLTMLEIGNARERELVEWKRLFEQADPRFMFSEMRQPPGSTLAILEVVWEG